MQKKIDIQDLDIPKDDIECWDRYPKHRWVYDLSRLLDAQNIKWSPFETLPMLVTNMFLETDQNVAYIPSYIYIAPPVGKQILTEVYITKGEIKHMRHVDKLTSTLISESVGAVELRISAFVSIHFQKFTGVISVETVGSDIYSIRLKPLSGLALEANAEIAKLIKRIYKKNDVVHISGLADQLLHESVAS